MSTTTRTCWYDYARVAPGDPVMPCDHEGVWRVRPDRLALAESRDYDAAVLAGRVAETTYACTTHLGAAVARYEDEIGCGVHVDRWS